MTKHLKQKNHFIELQKAHKAFFSNADKSGYFSADTTAGLLVEKEKNFLKNILKNKYPLEESIIAVERLAYIYILHAEYCLYAAKDKDKVFESLKKSYGYYILMTYLMVSCDKVFTSQKSFGQENMAFGLSLHFLFSGKLEKNLLSFLVKKLESSVIQSPFIAILKLIEKDFGLELPTKSEYPYSMLLDREEDKSDGDIDYLVSLLCETHIELSKEDEFFSNPLVKIFPYEILVWLKAREKAGLKNPKKYSHSMMNMPLTKMFLNIKEPLPKPTELPFAKELLEKLKEQCPEIKIPSWLEASEEDDKENTSHTAVQTQEHKTKKRLKKEIIKSNQIVQRSGIYQAFLPPEHPLTHKVHQMPESKRLGIAGVSMLPLGLSAEDEEQLRWEWIGE